MDHLCQLRQEQIFFRWIQLFTQRSVLTSARWSQCWFTLRVCVQLGGSAHCCIQSTYCVSTIDIYLPSSVLTGHICCIQLTFVQLRLDVFSGFHSDSHRSPEKTLENIKVELSLSQEPLMFSLHLDVFSPP